MRRLIRVLLTLLYPAALLVGLLPLIRFGPEELSMLQCAQLMLSREPGLDLNSEILIRLTAYLSPFLYAAAALAGSLLLLAPISLALPEKGALYLALVAPPLVNTGVFFLLRMMWDKLEEVRPALSFFFLPDVLALCPETVLIWAALWVLVILLALTGHSLLLAAQAKADWNDILPEMIDPPAGAERRQEEEQYRLQVRALTSPAPQPEPPRPVEQPPAPPRAAFSGAVLGRYGRFRGMAYPLQERCAVHFSYDGEEVFLRVGRSGEALAELYFVGQYQEYCLRPLTPRAVFLASGQPLGAGRSYFLPRGTEVYLLQPDRPFLLA